MVIKAFVSCGTLRKRRFVFQSDQSFLENMEDFVTLDELAEDEDDGESDSIGTRTCCF